jgi:hypothetical protein
MPTIALTRATPGSVSDANAHINSNATTLENASKHEAGANRNPL